jgi:hypothetical protein
MLRITTIRGTSNSILLEGNGGEHLNVDIALPDRAELAPEFGLAIQFLETRFEMLGLGLTVPTPPQVAEELYSV